MISASVLRLQGLVPFLNYVVVKKGTGLNDGQSRTSYRACRGQCPFEFCRSQKRHRLKHGCVRVRIVPVACWHLLFYLLKFRGQKPRKGLMP